MPEDVIRQVLVLLNELDPYGLQPGFPGGIPEDEYDLEAAPIAQILINDGTITVEQVDAIWLKWFSEPLTAAVGPGETKQFVARLNRLGEPKAPIGDAP